MGSAEVQPQLSRLPSEPKSLLSSESEELNKVLVLTIARAIHVTGNEVLYLFNTKFQRAMFYFH